MTGGGAPAVARAQVDTTRPDAIGDGKSGRWRFGGGMAMDCFDEGGEYEELDSDSDPEALYRSLISDEEHHRYWSEAVWSHDIDDGFLADSLLFADRGAEADLCNEIRLSELWDRCQRGSCTTEEFLELSTLVAAVRGIRGSLCVDCAMLHRPNTSANWALATTTLCRGHLRFRLGHARMDAGGAHHSGETTPPATG